MLTQLENRFDEMSGQIIDRSMWILSTFLSFPGYDTEGYSQ